MIVGIAMRGTTKGRISININTHNQGLEHQPRRILKKIVAKVGIEVIFIEKYSERPQLLSHQINGLIYPVAGNRHRFQILLKQKRK